MEIVALRTFKAVVDEGGIKGASEKLNTVQSNITTRIQKLEDELGSKLFTRVGRKLELTTTGQLLYKYASQILQLEYQASTAILKSKGNYELRIGMPETFAAVHLPTTLKQLKRTYPEILPRIYTDTSDRLALAVLNDKLDCALVGNAKPHEDLCIIPVVEERLVLVTPIDEEYEPVLFVREEGCGYRKCALAWQELGDRFTDEMMVMSSADGILGCIAAGLGYTVIGENMVTGSRYESSLKSVSVSRGQQRIEISVIYRKGHPLEQGILNFVGQFPEYKQ